MGTHEARSGKSRAFGTNVTRDGTHFRVMAPARKRMDLVLESEGAQIVAMERGGNGVFSCFVPRMGAGVRYRYRVDGDETLLPDPGSRFQPEGPFGPSEVIDPTQFRWRDEGRHGVALSGQVIYEMHVGTFTNDGTFRSATREIPGLAQLGITLIEVMPVAEFPGEFGWGYDGVNMYAPTHLYGRPDDFRAFVDEAHAYGVGVLLDVVYNHLGPDGNFLLRFFNPFSKATNDWGEGLDFDSDTSSVVRTYCRENAAYWIEEFHLDGLRLDATQDIHDSSTTHIISEIVSAARDAALGRSIVIVAENERQESQFVRPRSTGGFGGDALWNDDFHHAAIVAATGRREAYYQDTLGTPQELISALKWGYLYQGQYYSWQKQKRGAPSLDLPAQHFVVYLQNHDQVANSAHGLRLPSLTSPGRLRALKALMMLAPGTPMLFQGEEYDAKTPFLYFADHDERLARDVRRGRREFLGQFPSLRDAHTRGAIADPSARETFTKSKLDARERKEHVFALALTRDLLALRKQDGVFSAQRGDRLHGAVLGPEAFVLRYFGDRGDDRLVLVNLGADLELPHAAEPLLAPPADCAWTVRLSTEDDAYGGSGSPALDAYVHLRLHGHSTVVLTPISIHDSSNERVLP